MKKRIVAMILAVTMVTGITACGGEAKNESAEVSDNIESSQTVESQSASSDASASSEQSAGGEVNRDLPYWILQQDFSAPQKEFSGTLFNESAVLPLDLMAIDAYAAPYKSYLGGYGDAIYVDTIDKILYSDKLLAPSSEYYVGASSSTVIRTQYSETENIGSFDAGFCGIGEIEIYNLSENDEKLSVKTCYENGWWAIVQSENYAHKHMLQVEGGYGVDICDQIVEKWGSPTYIVKTLGQVESLDAWYASMKEDEVEMYSLIYEYDEFAIEIMVMENSFGTAPSVEINGVVYYPASLWEIRKTEMEGLFPVG